MSNSKLVSYTKLSPNYSKRTAPITKITIHHAAVVNASLVGMGNGFAQASRQASSNYGIDSNGNIAMYVEECNRAWTSSNSANDNAAVTIEVANCKGAPNWEISDKAYKALITLCVDICKRNGIKELNYTGDKNGNLTRHNMFAATTCPGAYLQGKFNDIAKQVNAQLKVANSAQKEEVKVMVELDILRKGATGAQVKTLQRLLTALGYKMQNNGATYGVDGSFGTATYNAVISFQKAKGLAQDGIVGANTWSALLK